MAKQSIERTRSDGSKVRPGERGYESASAGVEPDRSIDPETLNYEEVQSALHEALQADLSALGWPDDTKVLMRTAFDHLDLLIRIAEAK